MSVVTWFRIALLAVVVLAAGLAVQTCRLHRLELQDAAAAVEEAKEEGFVVGGDDPVIEDKPAGAEAIASIRWKAKRPPKEAFTAPPPVVWADPAALAPGSSAPPDVQATPPAPGETAKRAHWLVAVDPPRSWPRPEHLTSSGNAEIIKIGRVPMARVRTTAILWGPDGKILELGETVTHEDVDLRAALDLLWSVDLEAGVSSRPGLEVGLGFLGPKGNGARVSVERTSDDTIWHLLYRKGWRL